MRQMAEASQIFNPLLLKDIDTIVTTIHYLADKLRYFGYSHFSEVFMTGLKRQR